MRRWTRGSVLFAAGLVLGMVTIKSIEAQQDKGIGLRVNHVGIYVKKPQVCRLLADRFKRRSALLDTGTGS